MTVVRHTCDPLEKYNVCHKARPFPHGYNSGSAERAHSCGIEALQPHRLQDYVRRSTALRGADMGAWLHVEVAAGHEHVSFHQGPASPPHWTGQCMEEHAGHAMKYYEDKNNAAYTTQSWSTSTHITWTSAFLTTGWTNIPAIQALRTTSVMSFYMPRCSTRLWRLQEPQLELQLK